MLADININDYKLDKYVLPAIPAAFIQMNNCGNTSESERLVCGLLPFAKSAITESKVKTFRILHDDESSKKVVEISLDISDENFPSYMPGDTIGILPQNRSEDVAYLLDHLNQLECKNDLCNLTIKPMTTKKGAKIPFTDSFTPLNLLRDYLNFKSVPKKLFLRALVECTADDSEKHFIGGLSSKEGSKFYNELFLEKGLTFLDLLKLCPSCRPPLELLLEHLPKLLPRPYSIANSPLNSDGMKIVFSVLNERPGITTEMMANRSSELLIYLREPNLFRYSDEDFSRNQILISVGCAVAPFIGFLEHKSHLLHGAKGGGSTWLFQGSRCRKSAVYRDRLQKFEATTTLDRLFESFSRETDSECKYVQDHILSNKEEVVKCLLNDETTLYVCADGAQISKDIEKCIAACFVDVLGLDEAEAKLKIVEFKKSLKYREDIWL